jgi:hypothetical protein
MKVEEFIERDIDVDGWPVHITSYRIGEQFICVADNVSPGANLARTTGLTREDAESKALERAKTLLSRTHRHDV